MAALATSDDSLPRGFESLDDGDRYLRRVAEEFLHEQSTGDSKLPGAQLGQASAKLSSGADAVGADLFTRYRLGVPDEDVYTRYRLGVPDEDDPIGSAWATAIRAEEKKPEDEQQMCSICHEPLRLRDGLIRIPCGHTFHGVCMTKCLTVMVSYGPTPAPSYVHSCALCRSPFIGTEACRFRNILIGVSQRWDRTDADERKTVAPRLLPRIIRHLACAVRSTLEQSRCSGGSPHAALGDLLSQMGRWCSAWAEYIFDSQDVAEVRKYTRVATVFFTLGFIELGDSGLGAFWGVAETINAVLLPRMHLMQDGDREINKHIVRRIFIRLETILRRAPETCDPSADFHVQKARDALKDGLKRAAEFYGKAFVEEYGGAFV